MLKKDTRFIKVEKTFRRKEINGSYEWIPTFLFDGMIKCVEDCDFEWDVRDWNNDGDIYSLNCCFFEGNFGMERVTKDDFDCAYAEYIQETPIKKYALKVNNSRKVKEFTKVMDFYLYNTNLVLLETESDPYYTDSIDCIIITGAEFEEDYIRIS